MVKTLNMNNNNLFFRKEKLEEIYISKNALPHGTGSGDGSSFRGFTCCRLCGGDRNLRGMKETCLWEGVEERFDYVLYDCFGVKASPEDCKICTRCISQLMVTHKFRSLVRAAFMKTCSNGTSISGETRIESTPYNMKEIYSGPKNQEDTNQRINKKILDILSQKITRPQKRARNVLKISNPPKKVNASCSMCGQKYPIMIAGDVKDFVCSRCKLKKNTTDLKKWTSVLRKDENVKAEYKDRASGSRLRRQIKKTSTDKKHFQGAIRGN